MTAPIRSEAAAGQPHRRHVGEEETRHGLHLPSASASAWAWAWRKPFRELKTLCFNIITIFRAAPDPTTTLRAMGQGLEETLRQKTGVEGNGVQASLSSRTLTCAPLRLYPPLAATLHLKTLPEVASRHSLRSPQDTP